MAERKKKGAGTREGGAVTFNGPCVGAPSPRPPCPARMEVEALLVIRCTNGAMEPAVFVRPLRLDKKQKRGRMPRLRPTGRPAEIVPLAALIERLKVVREFAPADPPLRARRPRQASGVKTVPRKEPAGREARDWLALRDSGSCVLIPFGARSHRRCASGLEHEFGDDQHASSSESDNDETASEMYK